MPRAEVKRHQRRWNAFVACYKTGRLVAGWRCSRCEREYWHHEWPRLTFTRYTLHTLFRHRGTPSISLREQLRVLAHVSQVIDRTEQERKGEE